MNINFTRKQWDMVKENYRKWHNRELGRPLVPVVINSRDPGRICPKAPVLSQENCHDLTIPAKDVIDRLDWELSRKEFMGDAFPYVNFDAFGPGVLAAFLGARLDNSTGRVWFHPHEEREIGDLHFEFDENNIWFNRILDLYEAGLDRWDGQVLLGMPDLGGTLDILSTFRPGEKLLYDLYDHPQEVKRLSEEIHHLWFQVYFQIMDLLKDRVQGYTDWSGLYQDEPGYIVQCDFCYMISPDMFDEFVKNDLGNAFKKLPRNFYHLDGIGELPHLDSLLTIPGLKGVQWVPGSGQPDNSCWPLVYEKIAAADKLIQIYGDLNILEKSALSTDFPHLFQLHQVFGSREEGEGKVSEVKKRLEIFGI